MQGELYTADLLTPLLDSQSYEYANEHEKETKNKHARLRKAHKLVHYAEAHLRNTESQVITPKKGEVSRSSNGAKINISLLRRPQPTNVPAQNAGTSKSMSDVTISDRS